ncbi:hypothetical protein [Streptomyces echinatus]|uniref:hypothetical protein n=1 Tax=Streptomyces echinatus TaxID=67293 RepID=UPI0037A5EB7C
MTTDQILTLLLAFSCALNLGTYAGVLAMRSGVTLHRAILIGGSTVGATMTVFFTGLAAYHP